MSNPTKSSPAEPSDLTRFSEGLAAELLLRDVPDDVLSALAPRLMVIRAAAAWMNSEHIDNEERYDLLAGIESLALEMRLALHAGHERLLEAEQLARTTGGAR